MNDNGYGLLNTTPFGKYRAMVMEGFEDNPMQGDGFPNQRLIDGIYRDLHGRDGYGYDPANFGEILNRFGEAYLGPDWHRSGVTEWKLNDDVEVMLKYGSKDELGDLGDDIGGGEGGDTWFHVDSLQFHFEGPSAKVYVVGHGWDRGESGSMNAKRTGRLPVEVVYSDSFITDLMPAWVNHLRDLSK